MDSVTNFREHLRAKGRVMAKDINTTPAHIDPFNRHRMRREVIRWIAREQCSHALTLNADRDLSANKIVRMFGSFCLDVDRACLGRKNVSLVPREQRLVGFAFWEHPETNIHLHAALRLDGWWRSECPPDLAIDRIWLRITGGSGSTLLKPMIDEGWISYITKAVDARQGRFAITADYHPQG